MAELDCDPGEKSEGPASTKSVVLSGEPAPPAYSEDYLAQRFVMAYPQTRYVAEWSRWMLYQDGRWIQDTKRRVFDMARNICRTASEEYLMLPKPSDTTAKQIASARTVASTLTLASSDQAIAATSDQWDADHMLLNTPGGTVDLRTGKLREHRSEDHLTKLTAVEPAKDYRGMFPVWTQFLDRITASNEELMRYLQRVCGYCLTGLTREHAFFFFFGGGANGKTTLLNVLLGMLGDYGCRALTETFLEIGRGVTDRHPTELAKLRGARLALASEVSGGTRWNEEKIKDLTGGDRITARFMRQDFFEFVPQFKLVITGNHKPTLRNVDEGMRRRMHLVPFTVTIPESERDQDLPAKLKAEWPAILRWVIEGCLEWQRQGLNPPAMVRDATKDYFENQDVLGNWIDECCEVCPQAGPTKSSVLYQSYKQWAETANERVMSNRKFSEALEERGFQKRTSQCSVFDGIAVRESR